MQYSYILNYRLYDEVKLNFEAFIYSFPFL